MKKKAIFLLIMFTFSLSITCGIEEEKEKEKQPKIDYENGIKVIKNPKTPVHGEIQLELELIDDFRLSKGKEVLFYPPSDIEIDDEGNIYILDSAKKSIQIYDKKGHFLQKFGRKGQGPGEMERPIEMCLDKENNIYVQDINRRKVHIFNKKGEFIRTITLDFRIGPFEITAEGNILSQVLQITPEGERNEELVLINPEGKRLKTIVSFPHHSSIIKKGGINLRYGSRYNPHMFFCILNDKLGIYGYSSAYKLFVFGSSGKVKYIIEKNEPPAPITRKEKNQIIDEFLEAHSEYNFSKGVVVKKAFNFPKYRPFYNGIMTDRKGNIYVRNFKSILDNSKATILDMFNQKGYYVHRIKVSPVPYLIKQRYIYNFKFEPKTGEFTVKIYKIINLNQV
jgi:hypothetical protein